MIETMDCQPLSAAHEDWYVARPRLAAPDLRLVCLPHAGGGASAFRDWGSLLGEHGIEVRAVQYPGREHRFGDELISDCRNMVEKLADAWPQISSGKPCIVYGHSMGAVLAHELALELEARECPNLPRRIFLAGRNPPHAPLKREPICDLPEMEFLAAISRHYGNLPSEIVSDELVRLALGGILRADFQLIDRYRHVPRMLRTPMSVIGAFSDRWTSFEELSGWAGYTSGACRFHMLCGGHFFHQDQPRQVIDVILSDLRMRGA